MVLMCGVYEKCQIPRNEKAFLGEPDQRYCGFDFCALRFDFHLRLHRPALPRRVQISSS
jgi:hypothetical protein